jgi:hypothetical protein
MILIKTTLNSYILININLKWINLIKFIYKVMIN